jgi:TRAP-type uncharacterized transport system fused permease subunit
MCRRRRRSSARRRRQGLGAVLRALRLDLGLGLGQCRLHRRDHAAGDDAARLSRALAGAVEAVASSGGQIMPPLMGAGAFVMVELTGTPYADIVMAALLPAFLYFFAVWIGIDAFSLRHEQGLAAEDRPAAARGGDHLRILPRALRVLLWGMFVIGVTPQYAASLAILAGASCSALDANLTLDWKRTLLRLEDACINGGKQMAPSPRSSCAPRSSSACSA